MGARITPTIVPRDDRFAKERKKSFEKVAGKDEVNKRNWGCNGVQVQEDAEDLRVFQVAFHEDVKDCKIRILGVVEY